MSGGRRELRAKPTAKLDAEAGKEERKEKKLVLLFFLLLFVRFQVCI